ncbi:ABCB family ABC transporter ATP-binding protein/permease [Hellea balneolensis]|uniref:ABCB family ABC transporter ATP-binding protein/permease n=1 Tax=Hellea balneolensis TaxID=287478 RepID=UPI000407E13E|nr:ABC transporter ATP-binding protein/permease [Hellea balneolensis]
MPPETPEQEKAEQSLNEQSLRYQLKSFWRLWPYLWPKDKPTYKLRTHLAMIFTIAGQFIVVLAPFFLGRAIDAMNIQVEELGLGNAIGMGIILLILAYGGFRLASVMLSEGREYVFAPVAQYAKRAVATSTFAHLHKLSLRYHLEKRTGGLSRIIERGIRSIDFLFRFLLFNIGPTLLQLAIAGAAFWIAYSWEFALIAVAVVITYIWFTVTTTEWRLKFRRDMNKKDTEANAKAIDSLLNYETVKYFNAEKFETGRYDSAMEGYQKAAILSRTSLATVNIGQSFLMNLGLVALVLLSAQRVLDGSMTTGDIFAITMVMMQVYRPLNILGFAYREIKQALTDMEKMFALLDIKPEVQDASNAQDIHDVKGAITFKNVAFRYDPDRPILRDMSFDIKPGQTVAVVGPTGAGKSTLSRILFRFYDIESGAVTVDGQSIADITQDSLRKSIGIVPQDTVLFNDTVGYNIAYARPDATQDEIEAAAKAAQIHDFVAGLPKGYDTMVGERGLKLSGGEKQRVAIARTLLKNPAILILDEATSALDSVTERDIQAALDNAAKNRTTLVIAHRLSTITGADKIIVMEDGEIAEQGTHSELLKKGGLYETLWEQQEKSPEHA